MSGFVSTVEPVAREKAKEFGTIAISSTLLLRGCRPHLVREVHVTSAFRAEHGDVFQLLGYEVDCSVYVEHFHMASTGDNGTSSITLVKVWFRLV